MSEHDASGAPDAGRRDLLKLMGMAPLAGALDWNAAQVERATRRVRALAAADETGAQPAEFTPTFFTPREWRTVRMLADYVIPRDERSGSATDAKAPEFMDFILGEPGANENTRLAIRGGLAWLDVESRRRVGAPFVDATDPQRRQLLDDIAWPDKAPPAMSYGVAFFNRFRDMTAAAFFSSSVGWKDLQYIGNTFNPGWNGCPPEANAKLGVTPDVMKTRIPIQR